MFLTILRQSLQQMWGIILLDCKYHGNLPDIKNYRTAVKYSLPFRGQWVVVNGGVNQNTSHSWEIPTQRYAYDFIILDENGKSYRGDETCPTSFYCYGQDILAPADGVVVEMQSRHPNSEIFPSRRASCKAHDIRGNYVLIQHAENEYSLLAHLKPDSICVNLGEQVKRGQKIAECGNTGNTSEPHLHFQIQAGRSFFNSPGLPVEFENITVMPFPNYEQFDDREKAENTNYPPYITRGELVGNNK